MVGHEQSERNNVAYRRLKETIDQTYPKGWFVGIADDQVVEAAANFEDLESLLRARGKDPRTVLVVEAGVTLPDYMTIFAWSIAAHDAHPIRST